MRGLISLRQYEARLETRIGVDRHHTDYGGGESDVRDDEVDCDLLSLVGRDVQRLRAQAEGFLLACLFATLSTLYEPSGIRISLSGLSKPLASNIDTWHASYAFVQHIFFLDCLFTLSYYS